MVCLKINTYCFDCQPRIYQKLRNFRLHSSPYFKNFLIDHLEWYGIIQELCTGILRSQLSSNNVSTASRLQTCSPRPFGNQASKLCSPPVTVVSKLRISGTIFQLVVEISGTTLRLFFRLGAIGYPGLFFYFIIMKFGEGIDLSNFLKS